MGSSKTLFCVVLVVLASSRVGADEIDNMVNQAVAQALVATGAPTTGSGSSSSFAFSTGGSSSSSSSTSSSSGGSTSARSSGTSGSTSAKVGPYPATKCGKVNEGASTTCTNGKCCKIKTEAGTCKGKLNYSVTYNGYPATCCAVLLNTRNKNLPMLFCPTLDTNKLTYQISSNATVALKPTCNVKGNKSAIGLSCEIAWKQLPNGWIAPPATKAKPYVYQVPGFSPCGKAFRGLKQYTANTPGATTLMATCF